MIYFYRSAADVVYFLDIYAKAVKEDLTPADKQQLKEFGKSLEGCPMTKTKHSKMGKRLIAAMQEVVDHVEGRTALPIRYLEVPEDVDVRAIRSKLGLSQAEFSRRYAVSPRSLQEWEQGRRRPESAVRAYLTVIDRNPEAVEKALMNKP